MTEEVINRLAEGAIDDVIQRKPSAIVMVPVDYKAMVPGIERINAAAVSAMLDRLLHHGHVLKCGPRSWRTKTDLPPQEAAG